MNQRLCVARLYDGQGVIENVAVTVVDSRISAVEALSESDPKPQAGLLVPGLVDIQVNGGGGVLFNATPTAAALETMLLAHAGFGTTAMLPTVITDDIEVMQAAADAVAEARRQRPYGIIGIHFEGPHISFAKKGAHCADFIRPISDAEWRLFGRNDLGVKLVTVAPETVVTDDIARLVALGCVVFIGHSNASYQQAQDAIEAGASGFTHLYNAMSPFTSRAPGVTGAALLDNDSYCGLIVDGHHVDYAACRLAIKAKGVERIALVTDAMPPVGSPQTEFSLVDRQVVRQGDKLLAHSGELAGSVLDMASALRNSVTHLGVDIEQALQMATQVPLAAIGLPTTQGQLTVGSVANMVLLNDDLNVQQCWLAGEAVLV